jgi:hypothetical protein
MNSLFRSIAYVALAIALGSGLGLTIGWQTASAVTVTDSAGNPDAVAPLADPDDAGDSSSQSGGFSIIAPDQNGSGWTIGSPTAPDEGMSGQSQ